MTVRSALSIAAVATAACLGGAVPAAAAGGPQAPCETEYSLLQQGWSVAGSKTIYCEGKAPLTSPASIQQQGIDGTGWVPVGQAVGKVWVHHCTFPYPLATKYRLKAVPSYQITATCW